MTEDLEILQGAISAVVYQNYENGYAVLRVNVGGGQNVTVDTVIEARAFKRTRKLLMKIFPQGSGIRRTLGKMYWRIFG